MLIEVTQDRIDRGKRGLPHCCPIALAIHENLPRLSGYGVFQIEEGNGEVKDDSLYSIKIPGHDNRDQILLPESACRFIMLFDEQGPTEVEPFSFELDI